MQNAPARTVFNVITDFLATEPSPQEIIAYQLPEDLQARVHTLLDKNGERDLTPEEHAEMMDISRMNAMMRLLKVKMRAKLKGQDEVE
jgi:hypothetical protein